MKCVRQLLVVTSAVVLAAGCSSDDDDASSEATTATSADPTTVAEPATTEPATTEPATTEPATTEPATTEPAITDPLEITTTSGPVRGADSAVAGVRAFLAIPYAAPPVGEHPLAATAAGRELGTATRRDGPGRGLSPVDRGRDGRGHGDPSVERGLPHAECVDAARRRRAAGDGVVPRRWAQRRFGAPALVHRRSPRGAWRRGGQRQLPPRRARVPRHRRAGRRAGRRVRELRARRPDRRPALGRRQRRAVRWRRRQRHDLRRVGGRVLGVRPPRVDRLGRPVRPGDRPERRRMRPTATCGPGHRRGHGVPRRHRVRRPGLPSRAAGRAGARHTVLADARRRRHDPHDDRARLRPWRGPSERLPCSSGRTPTRRRCSPSAPPNRPSRTCSPVPRQTGGDAASVLALYPPEQFPTGLARLQAMFSDTGFICPTLEFAAAVPAYVRLPLHLRLAIQPVRARRHPRRRAGAPLRPPGGHPGPPDASSTR